LRSFVLAGAIVNAVLATVLYRAVGRPLLQWFMRFFQFPAELRSLLSRDRVVRTWALVIGLEEG